MTDTLLEQQKTALLARIMELEARLCDSEETLDAIRRGEIDALVVGGRPDEQQVYTLDSADRPYRVLIEQIQEGAVTLTQDGTVLYCNRRLALFLGTAQERVVGHALRPYTLTDQKAAFDRLLAEGLQAPSRGEVTLVAADGTQVPVLISLSPLGGNDGPPLLCGVLTDLTEQKLRLRELAEANARLEGEISERERVEDVLRQSQKMEAVGQLTGGLAHDFNNLLTGIIGALELLDSRIAQGRFKEVGRYVGLARDAANRAAALTHRLLAFSRRQTLDPKTTDVNRLMNGMEELIRRTVGPSVELRMIAADDLWSTLVDPSQLENALLNLCLNARDAMPDGGRLTVETANRVIDRRVAQMYDLPEGRYVTLCVSDTGTGMPPNVIAKAFDPFFTTKPLGMGTGLGLSMIYGFTRQSGGQVRIHSEVGRGSNISVYLPRHGGDLAPMQIAPELVDAPRAESGQTVLVVDDERTVRLLVTEVLEDLGYRAIEAADGAGGLLILQSDVRVDLLVTDVGLPGGINGRQVADAARVTRPELKVLFITGYAENAVLDHGHLEPGMHVLTKPFAMEALASRISSLIVNP